MKATAIGDRAELCDRPERAPLWIRAIGEESIIGAVRLHLLVSAGLVPGRTITSWPTLQDDLRNAGATWRDKECIRDGTWVSSRKPDDLPLFNREMVKLFAETQPAAAMRAENRESLGVRS